MRQKSKAKRNGRQQESDDDSMGEFTIKQGPRTDHSAAEEDDMWVLRARLRATSDATQDGRGSRNRITGNE